MSRHIGGHTQRPDSRSRASTLLRFESILKAGIVFRLRWQIHLAAGPIQRRAIRKLSIDLFGSFDGVVGSDGLLNIGIAQKQSHCSRTPPDFRNAINPPERSICSRKSGAGTVARDLPDVRFVIFPPSISTRRRSPVSTSW